MKKLNFKYNDGGRKIAGYKGQTGDCVVRAIVIATNLPYQKVYDDLTLATKEFRLKSNSKLAWGMKPKNDSARLGTYKVVDKPYLLSLGWKWKPTMFIGQGCKTHLRYDELPMGTIICSVSTHLVAVIDKVIHDTFDCSRDGTRCVYGYWYKDK
jgi:hypothetical protein|tara:strand:- start:49 stop:510 length:462 start_codon:yes stop_codon:yes gene_type:complete